MFHYTGQAPIKQNYPEKRLNSAKTDTSWSKEICKTELV